MLLARQGGGEPLRPVPLEVVDACMCHEQSRLLLRLCDVGLASSWLSTVLGPMAKLTAIAAGVVLCRLVLAGGATLRASAGITLGTSSRPGLGVSVRLAWLATLAAACRGRRLPLLPVTLAGSPLLPSEKELPASGDGPERDCGPSLSTTLR